MTSAGVDQGGWLIIGGIAMMLTGVAAALAQRRNEARTGRSDRAGAR